MPTEYDNATKIILKTVTSTGATQYHIPYVPVATATDAGLVRPDGTTVTVADGVLSVAGGDYITEAELTTQLEALIDQLEAAQ